jgi:hypothetical protein
VSNENFPFFFIVSLRLKILQKINFIYNIIKFSKYERFPNEKFPSNLKKKKNYFFNTI